MKRTGHRRPKDPWVPAGYRRVKAQRGRMNPFGYAPNKRRKSRREGFRFMVKFVRETLLPVDRYVFRRDWYSKPAPRVIRGKGMKPLLYKGRKP